MNIQVRKILHRGQRRLAIYCDYDLDLIAKIKKIPGRKWSQSLKVWHAPDTTRSSDYITRHFKISEQLTDGMSKTENSPDRKAINHNPLDSTIADKIEAVHKWMEQKRYGLSTIQTYISFIRQFFSIHRDTAWNEITIAKIEKYNHEHFINGKRSRSAQNQWINAIKTYLKVHQLLQDQHLNEIERPRKATLLPDVLTPQEVSKIIKSTANLKHKALLMLIYSSGLRIGEALRLKPTDIASDEGLIYIRESKGNKDRRVPLSPLLLEVLRDYYISFKPRYYLFEGRTKGSPYSHSSASKVLKQAVKKAEIAGKRITLHTLRHSYATHLTNRGVNIQYLQEILGHNSPKTTMLYTHLSGKDIRNIQSPLDDLEL